MIHNIGQNWERLQVNDSLRLNFSHTANMAMHLWLFKKRARELIKIYTSLLPDTRGCFHRPLERTPILVGAESRSQDQLSGLHSI